MTGSAARRSAPQRSTPRRSLTALRVEATVLMSLAIGQAGLAAGFLGGGDGLKPVHAVNAFVLVGLTLALLVTAVVWRYRADGPRWPVLAAVILLLIEALQVGLARGEVVGLHIFCGVLFVVLATLLTSYLFRPGFVPS